MNICNYFLFSFRIGLILVTFLTLCSQNSFASIQRKHLNKTEIAKILKQPLPSDKSLSFVVMGDTRDGDQMFLYLTTLAARMKPSFIIDVGDFVHSGAEKEYEHFLNQLSKIKIPFLTVLGNHERHVAGGLDCYKQIFGDLDYFFDYGGARFIILANAAVDYQLTDSQLQWLEKTLETNLIKFVFMHAPPKTHIWQKAMEKNSEKFMELVEKYGVRKVYFGHLHAYDKLRRGTTDYVMTGAGGAEPDPISSLYHKYAGGYYHILLVEIKNGKVMDVLIAPDTADIIDFPSPDGIALELPFASYRHLKTPIIESVKIKKGIANTNEPNKLEITAYSNPEAMGTGLKQVIADCFDSDSVNSIHHIDMKPTFVRTDLKTLTTRPHHHIDMKSSPIDERIWTGELTNVSNGLPTCSVKVEDVMGSIAMYLPPIKTEITTELNTMQYTLVSNDMDDSSSKLLDALDILNVSISYDNEYFYLMLETEKGVEPGNKNERLFNIYGFGLINENTKIIPEPDKMLREIPIVVYAPLATSLGFPKCGLYNFENYTSGKIRADSKGVTCKIEGKKLYVRVLRSTLNLTDIEGIKLIAATGQINMLGKIDIKLGDTANIANIKLKGYTLD